MQIVLTERFLAAPTEGTLKSMVDIWPANGGKVFSASFEPLNITSYKFGDWVDAVIDLAYETKSSADD